MINRCSNATVFFMKNNEQIKFQLVTTTLTLKLNSIKLYFKIISFNNMVDGVLNYFL
jgi:hypothetical protein